MLLAAQNRTAVAMAVVGKSRAALFRGFCSPVCSPPPPVLQFSDHVTAGGRGPALATATATPTPPPNLPPPFDQNAAEGAAGLKGLNDIVRPPKPKPILEEMRRGFPRCGGRVKHLNPAKDSKFISLADYCVQQISQIQDSQYKLVKIVEADSVLVAGLKIRITLKLRNQDGSLKKYRFEVWERSWLKSRVLLSLDPID